MSSHHPHNSAEHGTVGSYVTGFILSLVLTFAAYYLVVNEVFTGPSLQISILGLAVLQLIVQIFYFLHLGRGPKPSWNLYFFIGTVAAILVVVVGSIIITNNLRYNMATGDQTKRLIDSEGIYQVGGEQTGSCKGQHTIHRVTMKNGAIDPLVTIAAKCDKLIFEEEGGSEVKIIFGTHDEHTVYAGQKHLELRKGRTKTLVLSQTGTYQFHDHKRPESLGTFAVYDN